MDPVIPAPWERLKRCVNTKATLESSLPLPRSPLWGLSSGLFPMNLQGVMHGHGHTHHIMLYIQICAL